MEDSFQHLQQIDGDLDLPTKFDLSSSATNGFNFGIGVREMDQPQQPQEQYGYTNLLNTYRNHIDSIDPDNWKKVRWYINEFDFLVKDPIINRAFYKYWEIINEFDIFENYNDQDLILHCAEAPGGFIQGTNIYLQIDRIPVQTHVIPKVVTDEEGFTQITKRKKRTKPDYRIYTISLNKDLPQYKSYNLPSYNKSICNKFVCITYGKDDTGDINNWENIHYIQHISKRPFYLITADGGFDEGTDFNNKEQLHYCLILSEIYAAIQLQCDEGNFILKVFDVFTETSVHLIYLLSLCYKNVSIYKPRTSRPTNSEKYVICTGFSIDKESKEYVLTALRQLHKRLQKVYGKYVSFKLFESIPEEFIEKIKHMNNTLLTKQCQFLQKAVKLCQDDDFLANYDNMLADSIERRKAIFYEWGQMYNLSSYV
jgi:23S rRNA U2552 (ribose-2'-O)-methylase RlmE/FtsJ